MRDKTKFSKKAEEEYCTGFDTHLIYLYRDKHGNRISISKSNDSEDIYIKVFSKPHNYSVGLIDPPTKTPFGRLAIYFEDYEDMLNQLKGKCARRKFIRIIRELVVLGHRIGDHMIGDKLLWNELWEITEEKV